MLKEYGPGDRGDKPHTDTDTDKFSLQLLNSECGMRTAAAWLMATLCGRVTLTVDFNLHGADAVELCHASDFREGNFEAIRKPVTPVICAEHQSRILLK